jgi:hypothetical protein
MAKETSEPRAEIYRPDEALPATRPTGRLPAPEATLPADFPTLGFLQLMRLARASRLSARYAAALDSMASAYRAAAGLKDAQLEFDRAIQRLEDKERILATDKFIRERDRIEAETARDEALIRAEARKLQAQIEVYQARKTLAAYQSGAASAGDTVGTEIKAAIDRFLQDTS